MKKTIEETEKELEGSAGPTMGSSLYGATVFSMTMAVVVVIYALAVIFLLPTAFLEATGWEVIPGLKNLGVILMFSCFLLPFVFLLQLMVGVDFTRRKLRLELVAVLFGVVVSLLFFWPALLS